MFTDEEVRDAVAEEIGAMPDTATILRMPNPPVRTPTGGISSVPVAHHTTPCRLTASVVSGGGEQQGPGQIVSTMAYTMTVPPGTDIRASDQVQVRNSLFEVIADKADESWNISDDISLVKIN